PAPLKPRRSLNDLRGGAEGSGDESSEPQIDATKLRSIAMHIDAAVFGNASADPSDTGSEWMEEVRRLVARSASEFVAEAAAAHAAESEARSALANELSEAQAQARASALTLTPTLTLTLTNQGWSVCGVRGSCTVRWVLR
ncbi:MAG: hypothetical protein VXV98_10295, partial [Candidatus Thermoplasmatota archaeon]|nr:hypothetical protein [Candidatus Thermoplasmatota archaeon]